ncbi:hypothetical protein ACN38_g10208 [Penicillium nordicum]|uniref:Uncharacterized protein n=1 Tax=Penicillium nordicum TaxID=229535 RepID=A0A0M8NUE0_9EURO|nr:hypothetical protein ACN38_g10208 [Penicillium nordicum]
MQYPEKNRGSLPRRGARTADDLGQILIENVGAKKRGRRELIAMKDQRLMPGASIWSLRPLQQIRQNGVSARRRHRVLSVAVTHYDWLTDTRTQLLAKLPRFVFLLWSTLYSTLKGLAGLRQRTDDVAFPHRAISPISG